MRSVIYILTFFLILLLGCASTPDGFYYKVKKGETLAKLAADYDLRISDIQVANNFIREIEEGDYIFVPGCLPENLKKKGRNIDAKRDVSNTSPQFSDNNKSVPEEVKKPRFSWPVKGVIVDSFGEADGILHEGINIAVPEKTVVFSAQNGKVLFAKNHGAYGNTIIIQHDDIYISIYSHVFELLVKEGQTVKKGEKIALSGKSGNVKSPILHFEIRQNSRPVDPTQFLQ